MKVAPRQIDHFVKQPDSAARVILLYGPDNGLMQERARKLGSTVVEDLNDPFNAVTLSAAQLADDPARLADEACAMSLMGGGRLIRVEGATDKMTPLLKDYLDGAPSAQNLVVVEAGELGPRSSLRLLCEKSPKAAALACYVEDERNLGPLVRGMLQNAGYMIEPDALNMLVSSISGDRARVRSEIEKLVLYMGPDAAWQGFDGPAAAARRDAVIKLADVLACCADFGAQSMDDLIYNAAGGRPEAAFKAYQQLLHEGLPIIAIVRGLQNHFRRLHFVKSQIATGTAPDQALRSLSPPVFFKYKDGFMAQQRRWSLPALARTLEKLADLEAQCKQSRAPDQTLCAQALLAISKARAS